MIEPATLLETSNLSAAELRGVWLSVGYWYEVYHVLSSAACEDGVKRSGDSGPGPFSHAATDTFPMLVGVVELPVVADAELGGDGEFAFSGAEEVPSSTATGYD